MVPFFPFFYRKEHMLSEVTLLVKGHIERK